MRRESWSADVPVSQPVPTEGAPALVDFGGFGFATTGPTHVISDAEREAYFTPLFAPEGVMPPE